MSNTGYTTILFDYGGVLEFAGPINLVEEVALLLGVSTTTFKEEYFKHNYLANTHEVPWIEMFLKVVAIFDSSFETESSVRELHELVQKSKRVNVELKDKIIELKSSGFKVAVLSNYSSKLRSDMKANGLVSLFDEIFVSSEIGFQKPDVEAFVVVFKKLEVDPKEVIFIDDTPRSLETATQIGYTPILFLNNEQLFSDLRKLKIPV